MIVLETERLLFRDHQLADLDPFCAMEADPEVRRFVGGRPRTRDEAEAKFRSIYLPPVSNRMGMWATVFKPEGRYVGYCGVYPHFGAGGAIAGEGTLGYYLAQPYWGRGLATEAARAFVDFGFGELGLSRIVSTVQDGNAASRRILENLGFVVVRREHGERRVFDHFELRRVT
jgi:[ribosomal protein S5]-alanine N-acetyltransferase